MAFDLTFANGKITRLDADRCERDGGMLHFFQVARDSGGDSKIVLTLREDEVIGVQTTRTAMPSIARRSRSRYASSTRVSAARDDSFSAARIEIVHAERVSATTR